MGSLFRHCGMGFQAALATLLVTTLPAAPLSWQAYPGYRAAKLNPAPGRSGFTLLPPDQTRIRFTNAIAFERMEANQNLLNGAGVAAGDFDGDGLCDLYFCNIGGANALYRNLGDFRFENVTETAAVGCDQQSSKGAVFADLNGDGRLDLIVNSLSGPNACFLNLDGTRFTNVTARAGISNQAGGHSLTLADVDGDGDLDLYLVNYGENSILRSGGTISTRIVAGKPVVTGRYANRLKIINGQMIEFGEPDLLYLNDGQGRFTPVSWTSGAFLDEAGQPLKSAPWDSGLSAMFRDLNQDGAPDLYVCNDFQTPDRIWMNNGRGQFRALPSDAIRSTCHFSMGVDCADIDRDGFDDIFVGDMLSRFHHIRMRQLIATNPPLEHVGQAIDRHQVRRNTLLLNRGDGTYADIANFAGVEASDWSWSVVFLDVDLDGYEDLLVANGHAYDTTDADTPEKVPGPSPAGGSMRIGTGRSLRNYPPLITPNYLFRNRGNRTFAEIGADWGFQSTNVSHGIALADLDNDGDQDVVVSCLGQPPLVYRNESSAPRIALRLRGQPPNQQGIGARIQVTGGAVPTQSQQMICGGRYLSADDPLRVFAAGHATNRLRIEITWRNGRRSLLKDVDPNYLYEVNEVSSEPVETPTAERVQPESSPWFVDVSVRLAHVHTDSVFNDFERQPLLPKSLARLGPGVGWLDLDSDRHDDLIIGAGAGGQVAVYLGDGHGGFQRRTDSSFSHPVEGDLTGIVSWTAINGRPSLLVGMSNYEGLSTNAAVVRCYEKIPGSNSFALAQSPTMPPNFGIGSESTGPLAVADVDGDGDLDLFIGGRVIPGRYPEAASSRLFRNEGGRLNLDSVNAEVLTSLGLVSGAVFSDLTGDGYPDLVLACEWGPIRILVNDRGKFSVWNPPIIGSPRMRQALNLESGNLIPETLGDLTGWWNGVTTGDLDGDGRLDIVAANWGLNSSSRPSRDAPSRLYFGDFENQGGHSLLEAETESPSGRILPRRDLASLSAVMPSLRTRFPTHTLFSLQDVPTVLGPSFSRASQLQANTLASLAFLNRTNGFEPIRLPDEAQFAPAFGVNIADVNSDGFEDIFLSQNFFDQRPDEPRCDAGRGLWLQGLGTGHFTAVPGQKTGIMVYGEQRGSAVADFNEDGRPDLVVTQNNGVTKLFLNQGARPGLRVRLRGPPQNPAGLGATVRLKTGERFGPAREVHGGSGYWSQDSAVIVLAAAPTPASVWVRWPGGRVTIEDVPAGTREVVASWAGAVP